MVILYEIENIARFPREQDFASYCRLVKPTKGSNDLRTDFADCCSNSRFFVLPS